MTGEWRADPSRRHQYRYWNGEAWTDQVADNGRQSVDSGSLLPPPPAGAPGAPAVKKPVDRRRVAIVVGVVVAVAVLLGIVAALNPKDDTPSADALRYGAYTACQHFVTGQLKAPDTASFPDYDADAPEITIAASGSTYTVTAHVTAENELGVPLVQPFTCTTRKLSGSDWESEDVTVG